VQGNHITSQTLIYRLRGDARSRITSAYMTANFLGGAAGSAAAGALYAGRGWTGVCVLGLVIAASLVSVWIWDALRPIASAAAVAG